VLEKLQLFVGGDLDAAARALVRDHLVVCPACAERAAAAAASREALSSALLAEAGSLERPALWPALRAELYREGILARTPARPARRGEVLVPPGGAGGAAGGGFGRRAWRYGAAALAAGLLGVLVSRSNQGPGALPDGPGREPVRPDAGPVDGAALVRVAEPEAGAEAEARDGRLRRVAPGEPALLDTAGRMLPLRVLPLVPSHQGPALPEGELAGYR
jgi:hypothetical protein